MEDFDNWTNKQKIKFLLRLGHKNNSISEKVNVSKAYVSQVKKSMSKMERNNFIVYIEYLDHSLVDNGFEQFNPSKCACVGFVEEDTERFLKIKNVWSITLQKTIRSCIILKSTIIMKRLYLDKESIKKEILEQMKDEH